MTLISLEGVLSAIRVMVFLRVTFGREFVLAVDKRPSSRDLSGSILSTLFARHRPALRHREASGAASLSGPRGAGPGADQSALPEGVFWPVGEQSKQLHTKKYLNMHKSTLLKNCKFLFLEY